MIKYTGKETKDVKEEVKFIQEATQSIIKEYRDKYDDIRVEWFKQRSFNYKDYKGYLAPVLVFEGTKIDTKGLAKVLADRGIHIFATKEVKFVDKRATAFCICKAE